MENINTPQFWQQVKKEYEQSNNFCLNICKRSDSFKSQYLLKKQRDLIMRQAIIFLKESPSYKYIYYCDTVHNAYLFLCSDSSYIDNMESFKKVRLDFIDYMINKLS